MLQVKATAMLYNVISNHTLFETRA